MNPSVLRTRCDGSSVKRGVILSLIARLACLVGAALATGACDALVATARTERPFPIASVRSATRVIVRDGRSEERVQLRTVTDPQILLRLAEIMADYDKWPTGSGPRAECRTLLIEWTGAGQRMVGVSMCIGGISHYPENSSFARWRQFDDPKRQEVLRLIEVPWPQ